jgi:hypothetical protein
MTRKEMSRLLFVSALLLVPASARGQNKQQRLRQRIIW